MELTQGFSPHPKITLGPPLPVGVIALMELGEAWVSKETMDFMGRINHLLPQGLGFEGFVVIPEGEVPLSRVCDAGEYLLRITGGGTSPHALCRVLLEWEEGSPLIRCPEVQGYHLRFIMLDPDRISPSRMVKFLISTGVASSWSDFEIVRLRLGRFDGSGAIVDLLTSFGGGVSP